MSIQDLTPSLMLEHNRRWTDPTEPACQAIAALPTASSVLPELRSVGLDLAQISSIQTAQVSPSSTTDSQLTQQLADADAIFDVNERGAYFLLKALTLLAPAHALAHLQALQHKLQPHGQNVVRLPYRDEAGEGQRLIAALDPDTLTALTAIKLPWDNKTLADIFNEIIAAAQRIGTLDSERERLRQQPATATATKPPSTTSIKRRWAKAAKTLRSLAEIDKISPETHALLFATLNQDIAKTSR